MFEYDHHYYSVPHTYYKQEVTLKASYFDIIICDSMNHLICTHKRAYKPFPKYITKEEHMPESHRYYYLENKMNAEAYKSWARSYGPNVYEFICKVIGTLRYEEQSYKSCNGILHMCKKNPKAFSDTAAKICLESHIYTYTDFKKMLTKLINKRKQIVRKLFQNIRILGVNHIMNKTEIKEEQAIYMDLYEKLKSMKFSGMAEELRLQLENPNRDLESFQDRFEKLVTAEWNLRYNKKFERYLKKAKLKIPGATFDEKLYDTDRQLDIPTIEKLNTCIWIDEGRNLVVTGMTGTGKTYYVNALAVAALKQFKEVRYYSASKLLLELSAHEQVEDSIKFLGIMENIAQVDLLIIDDFGLMNLDVEKCRHLFEILDSRESRKSTVIVSQIPVKEWYDLFKDCTYADACLDRVLCKAYRLEFKGESLRNQKF